MSIIFKIDGSFELLDANVLRKGSVEALGESCNIDFYGVQRKAIYCEGGIPKKLNVELGKWRDGVKTLENQRKMEEKKRVVLTGGREVEITVREKREVRGKRKNMYDDPEPVVAKRKSKKNKVISSPIDELDDTQVSEGSTVANHLELEAEESQVGGSRKERRERERVVREPAPQLFEDDEDEEEEGVEVAGPPLSAAEEHSKLFLDVNKRRNKIIFIVLAAVKSIGRKMKKLEHHVDVSLEKVHSRIVLLENQAEEIADTLERQHTLVRSVADPTPSILSHSIRAAEGTSNITKMLPPPPPDFTYRYLSEEVVRRLDAENEEFLAFASAMDKAVFTVNERRASLRYRDPDRVRWMTECVLYRRRLGIGAGRKAHISDMRKRLNNYAGKERDIHKKADIRGHMDEEEEEDHVRGGGPREMDMNEEEREVYHANDNISQVNGFGMGALSEEEDETDMNGHEETERQMGPVIKKEGDRTYFQLP